MLGQGSNLCPRASESPKIPLIHNRHSAETSALTSESQRTSWLKLPLTTWRTAKNTGFGVRHFVSSPTEWLSFSATNFCASVTSPTKWGEYPLFIHEPHTISNWRHVHDWKVLLISFQLPITACRLLTHSGSLLLPLFLWEEGRCLGQRPSLLALTFPTVLSRENPCKPSHTCLFYSTKRYASNPERVLETIWFQKISNHLPWERVCPLVFIFQTVLRWQFPFRDPMWEKDIWASVISPKTPEFSQSHNIVGPDMGSLLPQAWAWPRVSPAQQQTHIHPLIKSGMHSLPYFPFWVLSSEILLVLLISCLFLKT